MLRRKLFITNLLLRRKGDNRESATCAAVGLTSENISATTSEKKRIQESNISVSTVRAAKFSSGGKIKYQETCL
jgi:hypothetical protein